jgi:predicted N-acetyltransferase YhbS
MYAPLRFSKSPFSMRPAGFLSRIHPPGIVRLWKNPLVKDHEMPVENLNPAAAFEIVAEVAADIPARETLLDRAMGPGRKRKSSEKLRRGRRPSEGLAFVARDASGALVGTVRLWDVRLGEGGLAALLLGPLAVDPSLKRAGIGSALMRHAVAEVGRLGHGAILLVGDAPYYGRFGFSADKTGPLSMPGPYERHRLLALELVPGALDGAHGTLKATGRKLKTAGRREILAA